MAHAYVIGKALGLDGHTLEALVRMVASYTVNRARVTKRVALAEALLLIQLVG